MNILVISDNFTKGGLEKQISTYHKELSKRHTVYYCFANYEDTGLLPEDAVFDGYNFRYDATVEELQRDVERLVAIINEKNIDLVHVHPWYGLYAACFAASKTSVKIVYTYHGTGSLNYNLKLSSQLLMEEILTASVSHVFCVGKQGLESLNSIHYDRDYASVLVNPIDPDEFPMIKPSFKETRKWALISRLDSDKKTSIEKLFRMLHALEMDEIDVFGSGDVEEHLKNVSYESGKKVNFLGHKSDLGNALAAENYSGVIGLGRCAIEGLAMGLPVLFTGYDKIAGLIDKEMYQKAKELNFVTESFCDLDATAINKQLDNLYRGDKSYYLRDEVIRDFSITKVCEAYLETIDSIDSKCPQYMNSLYEKLTNIDNKEQLGLLKDDEVLRGISDIIQKSTRNLNVKYLLFAFNSLLEIKEINGQRLASMEESIANAQERIINIQSETSNINMTLSDITLKKLAKRHIAARVNWLISKIK